MKKAPIWIFIAAMWLLGRLSAFCTAGVPWYEDPCYTNIVTTTCSGASISITNVEVFDCGLPISASAITTTNIGQKTTTSIWIAPSTNCPGFTNIDIVSPTVLSNSWVVAGPGSFSETNYNNDLSASFSPTNMGSGSITFSVFYQNGCDTNVQKATGSKSFEISCPTITSLTIDRCGVLQTVPENGVMRPVYGAVIHYHFQCANGWYSWENNIMTQNCDTTDNTTSQQTTATTVPWYDYGADGKGGDGVGSTVVNPAAMPCSLTSQQTIYFAPVGGGSVANNNSTCSFTFTRTLTIVADPSNPGHGAITLTVTGLANPVTSQCAN